MKYLFCYLLIINALSFALMLSDKRKAKKKLWRTPEAVLMVVAAIGVSVGVPCILAVQVIVFILWY